MKTHGLSKTPEYKIWKEMRRRCHTPTSSDYKYYGAKGIKVCQRWRKSFVNFIKDLGQRPSNLYSIERRNNQKGYTPSNCYWATRKEQGSNTCRNKIITYLGRTMTLSRWCDELGLNRKTILARIMRYNWPIHKALTLPKNSKITLDNPARVAMIDRLTQSIKP
jgi:hypothetical protein